MDVREEVINLFETEFMKGAVREQYDKLSLEDVADIVKWAPSPIPKKREIFAALAEDSAFYIPYRDVFDYAIAHMEPQAFGCEDQAAYMATCHHIDPESPNFDLIEIFSYSCYPSMRRAIEGIRRTTEYEHDKPIAEVDPWEDERSWVEVEKCIFDPCGVTRTPIKYWCDICGNPIYFELDEPYSGDSFEIVDSLHMKSFSQSSFGKWDCWPSSAHGPDIYVPLDAGDVIQIDGMPYVDPRICVVSAKISSEFTMLIYKSDGGFMQESSLRYFPFLDRPCVISPLYRLDKIDPFDSALDDALTGLSKFCRSHPDAYSKLARHVGAYELPVGPEELLFLMQRVESECPEAFRHDSKSGISSARDLLGFIESDDIRSHCEDIGWTPAPIEAAYLVWQAKMHTMAERHDAWHWIMDNMPDEPIPERRWMCGPYPSLHDFLRKYMDLEKTHLGRIFRPEPREWSPSCSYWQITVEYDISSGRFAGSFGFDVSGSIASLEGPLCRSLGEAVSWLEDELEENESEELVLSYVISRTEFGAGGCDTRIRFTKAFEPMEVITDASALIENDQNLWFAFEGMWFDIPVPFEVGDVLSYTLPWCSGEGFVLTSPNTDLSTERGRRIAKIHEEGGDISDMGVAGCRVDSKVGSVDFHCHYHDYLHLQRFRGELSGYERKLEPLGEFVGGEIGVKECMAKCRRIDLNTEQEAQRALLEERCEVMRWNFGFDVGMENFAGFPHESWLVRIEKDDVRHSARNGAISSREMLEE